MPRTLLLFSLLLIFLLCSSKALAGNAYHTSGERTLALYERAAQPWKSAPLPQEDLASLRADKLCFEEILLEAENAPEPDYNLIDSAAFVADTIFSTDIYITAAKRYRARSLSSIKTINQGLKRIQFPAGGAALRTGLKSHAETMHLLFSAPRTSACTTLQIWQAGDYSEEAFAASMESTDPFFAWYDRFDLLSDKVERALIVLEKARPELNDTRLYHFSAAPAYPLIFRLENILYQ